MFNKSMFVLIGVLLLSLTSVASATQYHFSQTGFDEGASISGSFTATDNNASGSILGSVFSDFSEFSAFSLSFSGNSRVPAFSQTLTDLSYLFYNTAKSSLGDSNPEGLVTNWFASTGFLYNSGVYTNGAQGAGIIDLDTGNTTSSDNLLNVTAVPEPEMWLTLLLGLSLLRRFVNAKKVL